jgi:phosphomevalonate kinase
MSLVASAPGKLVLLGEYAVLEGATAIAMAVDRRASARVSAAAGAVGSVSAPDVSVAAAPLAISADGQPDWRAASADAAQALSLVDQVLRGLAADGLGPRAAINLALDTRAFFDRAAGEPRKLGLGSSAALTVALASAVAQQAGHGALLADRAGWLVRLLALHRRFQGGRGSGVDVATSVYGGVIAYRNDALGPQTEPLRWPESVARLFVWSGNSASTPAFLKKLAAWRAAGHEAEYNQRMSGLAMISEHAVAAIRGQSAQAFAAAATAYSEELRGLGRASGVEIWSDAHVRIAAIASDAGCLYKPCGAGGGDVGVAFVVDDPERLGALRTRLRSSGFESVALAEEALGLKLEKLETAEA